MNFSELKTSLTKNILPNYFLCGSDIFVLYNALKQISNACVGDFADFNTAMFHDNSYTVSDLINACLSLPIGNEKRLVIIKGSKIKKSDAQLSKFIEILKNPPVDLCVVFFAADECELFDVVKPFCNIVDCNKLPAAIIADYVKSEAAKNNLKISSTNAFLICDLCGNEMGKVSGELKKLFFLSKEEITEDLIKNNIEKDLEFKIFELGDRLGKKDAGGAMVVLETLLADKEIKNIILPTLYSFFSRALFASITHDNERVAQELKIKPFAVLKAKELSKNFSQNSLRKICALILEAEENFKTGVLALDDAVFDVACKILL